MANIDIQQNGTFAAGDLGRTIARPFVALGRSIVSFFRIYHQAAAAQQCAESLMRLSDGELARRGIVRTDIPRIAFRQFVG